MSDIQPIYRPVARSYRSVTVERTAATCRDDDRRGQPRKNESERAGLVGREPSGDRLSLSSPGRNLRGAR